MNIQQLSERTGFSAYKIDLMVQEGWLSAPDRRVRFCERHVRELETIRKLARGGCLFDCGRQKDFLL
jgi:DNA-binding transcriptional MerR regulator